MRLNYGFGGWLHSVYVCGGVAGAKAMCKRRTSSSTYVLTKRGTDVLQTIHWDVFNTRP